MEIEVLNNPKSNECVTNKVHRTPKLSKTHRRHLGKCEEQRNIYPRSLLKLYPTKVKDLVDV